ncbi:GNAT family N-acetyltransferase [Parasedimentitalea huanghaiensis]|uniref:GNAT family N-acetyltransferase n=1 Tax=Parasedimentitalea huanghaiensis TaxID=2682100 RepID=A0A6L6WJ67_9RHOB|nr:GNAT family N-acetyltransferase [Zongyanglinia huanghaiensis]MVO17734.1 GNAT family N-acetyltransferase [Zongyanglinia huanghaiensis]
MTSVTLNIPVVETERLILRGHRMEDLDAMVEFFAGDRNTYVGGKMDRSDCWRAMLRGMGHWAMRGYGLWHIEEKATGKAAGWAGILHHIDWPEAELAYALFEGFEGKGFAIEAATAARDYAAHNFDIDAPASLIAPANNRSLALAKRMGATYEKDAVVLGTACQVWRHPSSLIQAGTS